MNRLIQLATRLGTTFLLILIIWGCGAVPELKEGSESTYIRLPFVRVLLGNDASEIVVSSSAPISVECYRGDRSLVYHASQPIAARQRDGMVSIWMKDTRVGGKFDEVVVIPRGKKAFLRYREDRYRGMFRILPHGANLELINIVHMDDYLKGVVPSEIGFTGEGEFEAIKAQAVAARTYSMSRLSQYPDEPYDMKSDVSDQLYHGVKVEEPIVSRAIDGTRGYVVKYRDQLIDAYYHSTCGGCTDDIDEVWEKAEASYLRAVSDSEYCSWSKYSNWRESYTAEQLRVRIEQYLSSERGRVIRIDDILDIYVKSRTAGSRVAELVVRTTDGSYSFGKDRIRWVFRRSSNPELILQSARFTVETKIDDNGKLLRADFIGSGYGHGVGMCQCGAIGMSRNGRKFDDILTFYYRNTELVKLY